jgi:hypothetical protein
MATQQSLVKRSGKLGNMVFYQREKKDVKKHTSKPYELSEESKKSSKDFGRASTSAAYIRKAFAPLIEYYGYRGIVNRLNARVNALFKTIPAALKGKKSLLHANLSQLVGFEFNPYTSLDKLLAKFPQYQIGEDGTLQIAMEKEKSSLWFKTNPKFQKILLQLMIFNFDLEGDDYEVFKMEDLVIDISMPIFTGARVAIPTTQQGKKGLLVALGASYCDRGMAGDRRYFACQINFAVQLNNGKVFSPVSETKLPQKNKEEKIEGISWVLGEGD